MMDIQVTLWENSSNGSTLARGFVKIGGFVQINISIYSGRNGPSPSRLTKSKMEHGKKLPAL
mgnify:CR=1 FL=1